MIFISKKSKTPLLSIIDAISCSTILGQAIGRWGNYFNSEAYGIPVASQNWGLFIPEAKRITQSANYSLFHPTFLYESFWNLCLFILLMLYFKHRKFDGEVFLLYLLGYGIGRFWIESLRTDQLLIPHINYPVSMALAATLVAVSAIWIGIVRYKQMKMGKMVDTPPQSSTKE